LNAVVLADAGSKNARASPEVNPVWLSVEDRLVKMVKSQLELNRQSEEIKSITTSITITLGISEKTTEILKRLAPVLKEVVPLLNEVPQDLKSIDVQFELVSEGERKLQKEFNGLLAMVLNMSERMTELRW
jgi:hypothetical protein